MALKELSLHERLYELSPEEKKRRYREAVKPFVEQNFKGGEIKAENYIGRNDSPTAGLTKQNFARATEGYAANNDGTYRYRATRELKIPDQIDQNPVYAAKDRMQYYLIDNPNAFDSPRELKTANDYWGQIYTVMSQNSQQGRAMLEQAKYFSTQYGNPLYNPYQTSTLSKDIKELFGEDSFSAEWVAENYHLLNNLELTAAGKAKAPTSKSTPEQILAYHFSKIVDAEANTQKAEAEFAALKQQITDEVAKQKTYGISKSVDEIYEDLKLNEYSTLKAMENDKLKANPYTLTRAVNYNGKDTVLAMIQAAMDKDDSDISGISDFTEYGGRYANEKYVDSQEKYAAEKREQLYKRFYEDERERYRQEQEAIAAGDTSIQAKYDAREIPRQAMASDGVTVKATDKKEEEPEKPKNWQRLRGSSAANAPEPEKEETEKKETEKPAQRPIGMNAGLVKPKPIDPIATEAEIQRIQGQLEAVDSDENAMPAEEYEKLETQLETLQGELRAYKAGNPEEFIDRKYSDYRKDPEFAEYAKQGANMESTTDAHEQYSDTYADPHAEHTSMTADEIEMYNYLLAKEGEAVADQYALDMQETINARQGKKVAEAGEDNVLGQLLYNYSTGFVSSLEGVASAFSDEVRPVGAADYARAEMAENNSDVQNFVNDMASSLGNMTPGLLVGWVTGGFGGAAYMGVSASGNAYQDAMRSGAMSKQDARNYGLLVGASEALLSYALSGISKLGGKATGKLINSINKIDNVFLRASAKLGANMVSEGFEEYLQAQIEPLLQNWLLGMDNDFNAFSEDSMYAALMGVITACVLEGGPTYYKAGIETRNQRSIGKGIIESNMKDRLLERAKASDNADVREAAEAIEAGTLRATESTLGQLAIEYHDNGGDVSFLSEGAEADVQPTAQGITTDYDSAMALSRAMRGEATESDLDLLEESLDIPNHEDTVNEIKAATSEYRTQTEALDKKEAQLVQLKRDVDAAQTKVNSAKSAYADHLKGTTLIQQGETLEAVLIEKQGLEAEIERIMDEAERVAIAGLEPVSQMTEAEQLNAALDGVNTKYRQLVAANREATVFQGAITNAQKSLDAANRNYAVVEEEFDRLFYVAQGAIETFSNKVSTAVNSAFGQNAMGMLSEVTGETNPESSEEFTEEDMIIPQDDRTADIKQYLKNSRFSFSDTQKQEAGAVNDSYGKYRKSLWGKTNIVNNAPTLDSQWEELSTQFPDLFPADTNEGDQVRILANVLNDLYPNTDRSGGVQYATVDHSLNPGNNSRQAQKSKVKPVTAQTIIRKASSALGVPIRTGIEASMSGVPEKAKAYYKQQAVAARVPGDIANIAHEIGHALDARHHFTRDNPAMAQKLTQNLPAQYASVYDAQALPGEAVADMVYTYVVQGEQAAVNFGGDAYYAFWNSLSRGEKRALRTMHAEVDQYRNQTADETGTRAVTQTKDDTDLRNASTKVKDMVRSASYNLMDNLDPAIRLDRLAAESQKNGFLTMDKHSETAFATARRAETIASAQLTQAMSDPSGNIIGDSFADCLKGVTADQMVDLSKYLAYVRALDWMDKGRKALDPAITKDEMITFCLKQQDTGVADVAEKIWAWYRKFSQAWLVDSGRMSQPEFNTLWKEEPHYVPFNRVIDRKDTNPSSFAQGIQQLNTGIHSVEGNGSQRDIFDPLTSLMQGVANITEATLRNEVGKTILWQVRNSENLEGMVTEVPASTLREDIKETAMMLDNGAEIMGQMMDKPLKKPDGTNIFGVVDEGGQISYIQVNDPQLLALMQNPNPKSTNKFLGAVAKVTRSVNATVTTLSGTFATRNLPSDANAAWRATPEKNPIRFFVDLIGSAADVINGKNHSADYYEWAAMGGLGDDVYAHAGLTGESARKVSTQYLGTRPSSVKEWGQRVGDAVNSMATALSAISENTTRLTLYKEGKRAALRDKQSGASARAAGAALSRMGTTDFNRSGAQTVGISTLFRFAGATINGNIQSARTLFDRSTDITSNAGKIKGTKVAIGIMARAAALAALSAALMDEDEKEQFRRMDPSAKYSGLVIPWSKFSGVKGDIKIIPYAKDAVSDLMNIGAAIADGAVHGGLWDDIRGIGENIAESLMPFGSPIWAPIDQASKNETWYGGKIIPGHLEDKAYGQLQYDEDTTAMSRWASTTLYNLTRGEKDVSPMLIDYVLEQYGGGLYDTAVGMEEFITTLINNDKGWEGVGKSIVNGLNAIGSAVRDGFTRNSITTSDVSGAYYNDVQFVDGIISTIKDGQVPPDLAQGLSQDKINEAYAAANALSKNLDALGEQISGLYDEMDEVRANQTMGIPDQEREVSEIRKEIYNLQLSGTALVDNYRMEYCGDPKSMMTTPRADAAAAKGYTAFNDETLPQSFRDKQDDKVLTRLRDFYQQDTSKTSFKPTYPPDFVKNDKVMTAWDDVDSTTKQAMEKAWTTTYIQELTENGFASITDYKKAKEIASDAKSAANKEAKEIYTIKYGFREDED